MSTTFKKSLAAMLGVILLAVIALFTLNLGFLKGFVEQRLSESTGLDVKISGSLDLRLGSEVRVKASQVTVNNPAWQGQQQVAVIDGLTVNAKLVELVSDTVRIRKISIDTLLLNLEQDAQSRGNWGGSQPGDEQPQGAPLQLDALSVASGSGSFSSPRLDAPLEWEITSMRQEITDDAVLLAFDGTVGKKAAHMELSGGPWSSVVGDGGAGFEADVRLGNVTLKGQADFDRLWSPHRPRLNLSLAGPDVSELADTLGIRGLGKGPLSLEIVTRDENDRLEVEAKGSLGELRIDATGQTDSVSTLTQASINLQMAGPNFGRLARLAGFDGWPESRFDGKLQAELAHPRLTLQALDLAVAGARISLSGTIPELPQLSGAEIDLSAGGPSLAPFAAVAAIDEVPAGPFSISGKVFSADDRTDINLSYETTLANGSVSGTIGAGQFYEGTRLEIVAGRADAAALGQALGVEGLPRAPWRLLTKVNIPDNRIYQVQETSFETEGFSARFQGQLGRESLRRDSDVRFEIEAARLSDLQALAGEALSLPAQPFRASGRVASATEGWRLEQLVATVAEDRIQLDGILGSAEGLDGTRLNLAANGKNAARFLPDDFTFNLPGGAYQLNGKLAVSQGRIVISESAFDAGPLTFRGSADIPWPLNNENGQFDVSVKSADMAALIRNAGSLAFDPNPLDIKARGHWRDGRIQFEAAEVKAGMSLLNVQGVLDLPPDLSATDLNVSAYSPDLSALGTFSGQRWESAALDMKTAFSGSRTKLTMSRFDARLGDSTLNGDFTVDFEPKVPDFDLQLSSKSLDLRPFLADKAETNKSAGAGKDNQAMIPDLEFPIETLAKVQGKFQISAGRVLMNNMTLQDSILRGTLRNGTLDVSELSTAGYRGRLTATLQLSPLTGGMGRLETSLRSEGLVFNLAGQPAEEKDLLPAFDIDISMTGDGKGFRQAAAGMNGKIMVGSEGGHIPNRKAKSASGLFLAEIVSTISPSASRQDKIQISCFATAANIRGGVVMLDPGVAVQSEKLNIFVTGKINLADEKLDASLRTETRKTVDVSASELVSPYVKLSGTLSSPSLKIDPKGTLLSGGAAYLSGGLSILAKKALDQLGGTSNPCDGYLETKAADKQP